MMSMTGPVMVITGGMMSMTGPMMVITGGKVILTGIMASSTGPNRVRRVRNRAHLTRMRARQD